MSKFPLEIPLCPRMRTLNGSIISSAPFTLLISVPFTLVLVHTNLP